MAEIFPRELGQPFITLISCNRTFPKRRLWLWGFLLGYHGNRVTWDDHNAVCHVSDGERKALIIRAFYQVIKRRKGTTL